MKGILIRWMISALSLLLVSHVVPGIHVQSFWYALPAAAGLGILNAIVRPILIVLTLPLTIFTLGLFLFIINGLMLWMLSGIFKGIYIDTFWSAVFGALILSVIGWLTSSFINERGHFGYIDLKRGPDGRWY
jgi:putative membrane protein